MDKETLDLAQRFMLIAENELTKKTLDLDLESEENLIKNLTQIKNLCNDIDTAADLLIRKVINIL